MLKIRCPSCGKEVDSDSNFCMFCGCKINQQNGVLSRLRGLFTVGSSSKETYDNFLKNKNEISEFINLFSKKEYISEQSRDKIKNANENYYKLCLKLKGHVENSECDLTEDELELLNSFINHYENIDEHVNKCNNKVIDDFYNEFKENKNSYVSFIDRYKTNISYDELITDDIKKEFSDDYYLVKSLINFEETDNYDLSNDKKLIHEFVELYENFDNVQKKINEEISHRENLVKDFEKIKPEIIKFNEKYDIESSNVYVKDYQNILDDYESYNNICVQLNQHVDGYHDDSLSEFLSIYSNFEIHSRELNIKFINRVYENFLKIKDKIERFVSEYKTNPSYDTLLSSDLKEKYKKEAEICIDLKNFEKTDDFDLKNNRNLIYDFVDAYSNFDEIVKEINNEISRREKIVLSYDAAKNTILKFIDKYKNNISLDLFIKDYESELDNYKNEYDLCRNLSKLPSKYHDNDLDEFLEIFENFEDISEKINENYLDARYNLFLENKSEISNQIDKYKNLTVDVYLNNKECFLDKFQKIYPELKKLSEYDYELSGDELSILNNFFTLYHDFDGEFPSKYYKLVLNYKSVVSNFISKYGQNSKCSEYIFDKNKFIEEYSKEYEITQNLLKLYDFKELKLDNNEKTQISTFIQLIDDVDELVIRNNSCYVEMLKNEFSNQKNSILKFIGQYNLTNSFNYYIDKEASLKILKNYNKNYELCHKMVSIPQASNNDAEQFVINYENFDNIVFEMNKKYVNNLYCSNMNALSEYVSIINLTQNFYVSNSKLKQLCENYCFYQKIVLKLLEYCTDYNYIDDKSLLNAFPQNSDDLIRSVSDANKSFISRELKENEELFNNVVPGKPLDENQRRAVVIDEDNTQIIAGAGCGKTLTLQAKAKYLIERKGIDPEEILAISYSTLAQNDLKKKMDEIGAHIDVSTFHSLGLSTLRKNKIKSNVLDKGLKDAIKEYFLVKIIDDAEKIRKIIEYFGYFMYEPLDKQKIDNIGEVYDYERGMDLETLYSKFAKLRDPTLKKTTLQGERVKSLEERRIANFLFINGVKYSYEKSYEPKIDWQKTYDFLEKIIFNDTKMPINIQDTLIRSIMDYLNLDEILEWPRGGVVEKYHPDFYLDDYEIYYEHFGVNRQCLAPWLPRRKSREYKKEMRNKRFLHKKYGTELIETYSYYQSENRLLDRLEEKLKDCGVKFKKIDYQQFMIDLLNDETKINEYWDFIKLVETFISLFKGNGYEKDKFKEFNEENESREDGFLKEKHRLFLEIVEDIYDYYYEYLEKHDAIDFNDMINNATNILKDNDFYKNYRYILVDEFQDTSHTRFNFLKTLKNKLNSQLVVVGDDWQSIYQFTGCDINLFTDFESYFDDSKTEICYITNTYRNSQSLIDVSGNFIMKNESQFKKQLNSKSAHQIQDTVKLYQYLNFLEQPFVFEVMINDIYKSSNKNKVDILVLGRNRADYKRILNDTLFYTSGSLDDKNLRIHYRKNPRISIRYMTVHGSKGLEDDDVILINMDDSKKGFPNKMEDDSVLSFVKNIKLENIEFAEERRLFYVALTRTKQRTYLLAPKNKTSGFVNEIINDIEVVDYELDREEDVYDEKIRVIASLDKECPHCGTGKINLLFNPKTGKMFFKCSNWPKCDWFGGSYYDDVEALDNPKYCPKCGGLLVKKQEGFYGCMNYFPDKACRYRENIY